MRLLRPTTALIFALFCLVAQQAFSQTLDALAKERKTINATLAQHKERTEYLRDRIERAKEDVAAADAALVKQEAKLSEAIGKVEENPGDSTARAATHASIRYNRTEAKTERMQERLDSAKEELASIQAHEIELNKRLAEITIEEARIAESQRKPKAVPAAVATTPAKPTALPAPIEQAQTTAPVITQPATWPTPTEESAADAAFAKQTLSALQAKPAGTAPLNNVKLNHNRGRATESLDYIGGKLFKVTLKLEAGMWGFKIYNDTFWVSVPKDKADQDFTLIYDVNSKATLHVFRTSLLN